MPTDPDSRLFVGVRRVGGLVLVGTVAFLAVVDALSPSFAIDPIALGIIAGTGAAMFGLRVRLPR